jgi:hypothetical protein
MRWVDADHQVDIWYYVQLLLALFAYSRPSLVGTVTQKTDTFIVSCLRDFNLGPLCHIPIGRLWKLLGAGQAAWLGE